MENSNLCLIQTSNIDPFLIMREYDSLPAHIRKRVQEAPFRICVACVRQAPWKYGWTHDQTIDYMIACWRAEQDGRPPPPRPTDRSTPPPALNSYMPGRRGPSTAAEFEYMRREYEDRLRGLRYREVLVPVLPDLSFKSVIWGDGIKGVEIKVEKRYEYYDVEFDSWRRIEKPTKSGSKS